VRIFAMRNLAVPAVAITLALSAGSARADFIVLDGNTPGGDNVLFQDFGGMSGSTVTGNFSPPNGFVNFTSTTQTLFANGGQARVEAIDMGSQVAITGGINVEFADPLVFFTQYVFNAFIGGGLGDGGSLTIDVFGIDSGGNAVSDTFTTDDDGDPLTIGNGSNFFTVQSFNGQLIRSVVITPTGSYADLRQNRIDGIRAIPEPSSFALAGLGVVGLAGLARVRSRSRNRNRKPA